MSDFTISEQKREKPLIKFLFSLIFVISYHFIHTQYLVPMWNYLGYNLRPLNIYEITLTYVMAILPIFFYSGIRKVSSFLAIVIYLMAYVPIIMTLHNTIQFSYSQIFEYQFVLMLSMITLFVVDKFSNNKEASIKSKIPMAFFHAFALVVSAYLLIYFAGNMRFVGLEEIYALRVSNAAIANPVAGYFIMWSTYFIFPIYLSMGFVFRNKLYVLIGILGEIMIFMIDGSKASLSIPIIIYALYWVMKRDRKISFFQLLSISIVVFSLISYFTKDSLFILGSIFLMRTLSMPGSLFAEYAIFFSNNEYTYYSHIGIVNSITQTYPYGNESIGQVIGWAAYGDPTNANANFWATDGIASAGLLGVIIITIVLFFFFLLLNKYISVEKSKLNVLAFSGSAFTLLNASFFTTLLSGGMLGVFLFLLFFDFEKEDKKNKKNKNNYIQNENSDVAGFFGGGL